MGSPSAKVAHGALSAVPGVLIYKDFFRLIRVTLSKNILKNHSHKNKRAGIAGALSIPASQVKRRSVGMCFAVWAAKNRCRSANSFASKRLGLALLMAGVLWYRMNGVGSRLLWRSKRFSRRTNSNLING